ncbi:DNA-binding protein [Hydrocarboniphaga effusa]|uniref:DNA-binding protein n=1 Tax=Hydrocarboniphaga effusa TaxID=243629 RepID=UPI003BAAE6F1
MSDWNFLVPAAADKLAAEGRKVTAESVRAQIGYGSLRDICPALRNWRESRRKSDGVTATIPAEVQGVLQAAAVTAWSVAGRIADERIAAIEAACQDRILDSEAERDAVLAEAANYETQLDEFARVLVDSREAEKRALEAAARMDAERKVALERIERSLWKLSESGEQLRTP